MPFDGAPPLTLEQVARVGAIDHLKRARDFLVTHDWAQGRPTIDKTKRHWLFFKQRWTAYCVGSALVMTSRVTTIGMCPDDCRYCIAADTLNKLTGGFILFNDSPGRTKAEVVAKFDEAIAVLERQL